MKSFIQATVTDRTQISPNMIRVRLQSAMIKSFPVSAIGGHIKLIFPKEGQSQKDFGRFIGSFGMRKRMRTYTIRNLQQESGEIDVDFVAHGDEGPASAWALSANLGDFIGLSFPGSPKMKRSQSNKYLVAVDMTAFPAAATGIEALPADAQGDVYTEILSKADIQPINAPDGINLHWIVNNGSEGLGHELVNTIRSRSLDGDESVFVAGEYKTVGDLRSYFRDEKKYPKDQLYISSYWKRGLIEAEHKRVKTLVA
ncbi:MAG: siderophore-interacting protein [Hellea sp.]